MSLGMRRVVEEKGWESGTNLENLAARRLDQAGFRPRVHVDQQHRVGRYRLDFAWPELQIALEIDGWHHRSPEGAARDAERDSWLRSKGWLVLRVDDRYGEHSFEEQLVRVCRVVWEMARWTPGAMWAPR